MAKSDSIRDPMFNAPIGNDHAHDVIVKFAFKVQFGRLVETQLSFGGRSAAALVLDEGCYTFERANDSDSAILNMSLHPP